MNRRFDKSYYDRFYRDDATRVASPKSTARLVDFVAAYMRWLRLPVRKILDVGCGLGYWHKPLAKHFPRASYHGIEVSEYLCQEYGWTQGSVVSFRSKQQFDLVICQGVLQYLSDKEARAAIDNLATLTRGVLYVEALTTEDWEQNCDRDTTDDQVNLRSGSFYRRRIGRHFTNCGSGLFIKNDADAHLFELERLE